MKRIYPVLLSAALLTVCAIPAYAAVVPLKDAIELSAKNIADKLPKGSRVAVVAFESEHDNLSDYIMEEITGALVNRGIEVADRQQ